MSVRMPAPDEVVARLGSICLRLPEVYEEDAWVGVRWRVHGRTFAHVLTIEHGAPPAYARAAGTDGPARVLTFRSSGPELAALRGAGAPYFAPPWRADEIGLVLGDDPDWNDIGELLTESYCQRAPVRLRRSVERPGG